MGKMVIESEFAVGDFVIATVTTDHGPSPGAMLGKIMSISLSPGSLDYELHWYGGKHRARARDCGIGAAALSVPSPEILALGRELVEAEADLAHNQTLCDSLRHDLAQKFYT